MSVHNNQHHINNPSMFKNQEDGHKPTESTKRRSTTANASLINQSVNFENFKMGVSTNDASSPVGYSTKKACAKISSPMIAHSNLSSFPLVYAVKKDDGNMTMQKSITSLIKLDDQNDVTEYVISPNQTVYRNFVWNPTEFNSNDNDDNNDFEPNPDKESHSTDDCATEENEVLVFSGDLPRTCSIPNNCVDAGLLYYCAKFTNKCGSTFARMTTACTSIETQEKLFEKLWLVPFQIDFLLAEQRMPGIPELASTILPSRFGCDNFTSSNDFHLAIDEYHIRPDKDLLAIKNTFPFTTANYEPNKHNCLTFGYGEFNIKEQVKFYQTFNEFRPRSEISPTIIDNNQPTHGIALTAQLIFEVVRHFVILASRLAQKHPREFMWSAFFAGDEMETRKGKASRFEEIALRLRANFDNRILAFTQIKECSDPDKCQCRFHGNQRKIRDNSKSVGVIHDPFVGPTLLCYKNVRVGDIYAIMEYGETRCIHQRVVVLRKYIYEAKDEYTLHSDTTNLIASTMSDTGDDYTTHLSPDTIQQAEAITLLCIDSGRVFTSSWNHLTENLNLCLLRRSVLQVPPLAVFAVPFASWPTVQLSQTIVGELTYVPYNIFLNKCGKIKRLDKDKTAFYPPCVAYRKAYYNNYDEEM